MNGHDPFEAGQGDALRSTDELLDRIAARAPTPEDLDDPVVAALALMAAEIDLDAVSLESTRGALERALPEFQLRLHRPSPASVEEPGRVLDIRDEREPEVLDVVGSSLPPTGTETGWFRGDASRAPRRGGRRPEHAAVAMAPPRSLPTVASPARGSGRSGSRPQGRPARRLRPLTALVAAVAAIILGSGVTAAVTGGQSVNPLFGLQQVVFELKNGRTVEQQQAYEAALQRIQSARSYAQRGDRSEALRQLNRVRTDRLSEADQNQILAQEKQVIALIGRA